MSSTKLNIIVAAPTQIGRTKVGLNLGQAFSALGHRVCYFDYDDKPWYLALLPKPLRPKNCYGSYLDYINHKILKLVDQIKPDLFLCVKGVQFKRETIAAIGKSGVMTAGYWIDDPLDHKRSLDNAGAYHYYFTNDASSTHHYREVGIENIIHFPSAADTATFYPIAQKAPLADLIFVGTYSPYREAILSQLQDFDLRVYGPGWKKSGLKRSLVHPEIFGHKTNLVFNSARINLNIHNWFGQGSAMNLRLYEVPASGGFLLTDWVKEIDTAYTEDTDLVCWRNIEELREKISYYLSHEDERIKISHSGHARFLDNHSYTSRARFMLSCLR